MMDKNWILNSGQTHRLLPLSFPSLIICKYFVWIWLGFKAVFQGFKEVEYQELAGWWDVAQGKGTCFQAWCLSQCSIIMKKHPEPRNSSKGKHLLGAGLQFQKLNPWSSWQEVLWHAGRHGAGEEVAESSTSWSAGSRKKKTLGLEWAFWNLTDPQWHTFSHKAMAFIPFKQGHTLVTFVPLGSMLIQSITPKDLSLTPRTHIVEGGNWLLRVVLWTIQGLTSILNNAEREVGGRGLEVGGRKGALELDTNIHQYWTLYSNYDFCSLAAN